MFKFKYAVSIKQVEIIPQGVYTEKMWIQSNSGSQEIYAQCTMAKAIMLITEPLIITEKHLMNVLHKYLENFQTFALVFTSEPVQ